MRQRMRKYALLRREIRRNDLREDVETYAPAGTVNAAISVATGTTLETNEVLKIKSTHRALSPDAIRVGDRFGGYLVDYVIPGKPYSQIFLSREEELP